MKFSERKVSEVAKKSESGLLELEIYNHTWSAEKLLRKKQEFSYKNWSSNTINSHKRLGYDVRFLKKDLIELARNTNVCPICKRKLVYFGNSRNSNRASLDRIYCDKVLTLNNVWIICWSCNAKKGRCVPDSTLSIQELIEWCHKKLFIKKFW